jgi:hypothetical protein
MGNGKTILRFAYLIFAIRGQHFRGILYNKPCICDSNLRSDDVGVADLLKTLYMSFIFD